MHRAYIKNYKIKFVNPDKFLSELHSYEGKEVIVKLSSPSTKRTGRQNRYYWRLLELIEIETGQDSETLHAFFKDRFLDKRKFNLVGNEYEVSASTTKLDTKEMTVYVDKIIAFASTDLGIRIPDSY